MGDPVERIVKNILGENGNKKSFPDLDKQFERDDDKCEKEDDD